MSERFLQNGDETRARWRDTSPLVAEIALMLALAYVVSFSLALHGAATNKIASGLNDH